jgi:hypothetical protein
MKNPNSFAPICRALSLPIPEIEYRFHQRRKWRFDYAWPDRLVALEVEGGAWVGGRHNRGLGFLRDIEKYNEAVLAGWCVLRCTPKDIKTGAVFDLLKRAFGESSDVNAQHSQKGRRKASGRSPGR